MKGQGRRRVRQTVKYLLVGLCVGASFLAGRMTALPVNAAVPYRPSENIKPSKALKQEQVLVIGGSMAYGWKDPNNDSYIQRAFDSLSKATATQYTVVNDAIVGASAHGYASKHLEDYKRTIATLKPSVVVISWGLLNDIAQKTTEAVFQAAIRAEIAPALDARALVLIVTPPVVRANATYAEQKTMNYIAWEKDVVDSYRNPDVETIDLYAQMMQYLKLRGETYQPYYGDNWHPNQAGHILAGTLLENDILSDFGQGPLGFIRSKTGA